jgi:hypothetical protein
VPSPFPTPRTYKIETATLCGGYHGAPVCGWICEDTFFFVLFFAEEGVYRETSTEMILELHESFWLKLRSR